MRRGRVLPILFISGAIVLLAVYFAIDPAEVGWMPKCPVKWVTGLDCPGCGSQRMVHALLHGDISAAWHYNALALCSLPLLCFMLWLELTYKKHPTLYRRFYSPVTTYIAVALIIGWFIVRNLPKFLRLL